MQPAHGAGQLGVPARYAHGQERAPQRRYPTVGELPVRCAGRTRMGQRCRYPGEDQPQGGPRLVERTELAGAGLQYRRIAQLQDGGETARVDQDTGGRRVDLDGVHDRVGVHQPQQRAGRGAGR